MPQFFIQSIEVSSAGLNLSYHFDFVFITIVTTAHHSWCYANSVESDLQCEFCGQESYCRCQKLCHENNQYCIINETHGMHNQLEMPSGQKNTKIVTLTNNDWWSIPARDVLRRQVSSTCLSAVSLLLIVPQQEHSSSGQHNFFFDIFAPLLGYSYSKLLSPISLPTSTS